MKALVTTSTGKYHLEDVNIPSLGSGEVLVKVEVAAQNPADWKNLPSVPIGHIIGSDFAGTVHAIGPDVDEGSTLLGKRVAGMVHGGATRNGAFAEFVVAQAGLLFYLPDEVTFEDGAQLAVAAMSACLCLYQILELPTPYDTPGISPPAILIWSGATAVGRYAIQLAKLANMRVFASASPKQHELLKGLGADEVFDYSDSFTGRNIFEASGGKLTYAVDCWSDGVSPYQVSAALSKDGGKVATVLPYQSRKKSVETSLVSAYTVYGKDITFPFPAAADMVAAANGRAYAKLISRILREGKLQLGSVKLFSNGLLGVVHGMEYSRLGKAHGEKIIYRISDTPVLMDG